MARALLAIFLTLACAPRHPMLPPAPPPPIPADLKAKVETSIEIGRQLYLQDKVASIATDVMFGELKEIAKTQGIAGYLAFPAPEEQGTPNRSWIVVFYTAGEHALIKYRVRVPVTGTEKPKFERVDPPTPASELLQFYIDIRTAAMKAAGPFTQPMNPIVMPAGSLSDDKNDVLVELIAGTKNNGVVVLGKHFRVIAGNDGAIKSVTPLSRGPLELKLQDKPGKQLAGLIVSEVVADYPLEIHVLASLQAKLPLYVGNARGKWKVEGDEISLMELAK
jgi:hypothetical protein